MRGRVLAILAAVLIVGVPVVSPLGRTPLEAGIRPGERKIYLELEGFSTHVTGLQVKPATPVVIDARMQLGLSIRSTPAGAAVTIDGKKAGKTPVATGVEPGAHQVRLALAGYKPAMRTVEVAPGRAAALAVILEAGASLTMRTVPTRAAVSMGHRELGPSPVDRVGLSAGTHTLTVSHPARRTWRGPLTFNAAEAVTARVTLGRPVWPVWVAAGATVVGLVMGIVGTVGAKERLGEWDLLEMNDRDRVKYWEAVQAGVADGEECVRAGINWRRRWDSDPQGFNKMSKSGEMQECPKGFHYLATVGYTLAATAAASGLLYYLIWGRHEVEVERQKLP